APYTLKEAALLFESGSWKQLDLVIGVYCPKPLRLARVMKRDGVSEKDVLARMNKQMDEDEKMRRCQFVIQNDEKRAILPQVLDLHRELLGRT
ncbi:MAG TPA: dephospho-CoA kinase, partial [Phnomibacter sp.]|nr:dephospho-CoA kinase [Phnomibacter sp.]